jgi:UDP:flavonoid glycosyltransferase YjiC (YdhE family)
MKIIVVGWGTTGDVYPLLALSERLSIEHQVRVCAPSIYIDKISQIGTDYYQVGTAFDLTEFHQTMDSLIKMRDPMAPLVLIAKEGILRHGEKWYNDCLEAMKGYDLVVCHSIDIPAQEAAIRLGIPWITVTYCPGFIKTADNAPYPFPNWSRTFNRFIWRMVRFRLRHAIDPLFNQFIISIGGKPRTSVALEGRFSPHLNLIAASPTLCPSTTLPGNHKITGAWYFAEPNYLPPPDLVDFFESGTRPIVISFGSVSDSNGHETTEILINAVRMTGQRAIIQSGWGQLGVQDALPDIFCTGYIPHHWLFTRASCIVHHGGAGTTTSACRAGVPSILVPHHPEQSYWGKRLFDLGVAPKSLHRRNLTVKRLAKRINQVLETPMMTKRAQQLRTQMKSENGLLTATHLIQSLEGFTQVP